MTRSFHTSETPGFEEGKSFEQCSCRFDYITNQVRELRKHFGIDQPELIAIALRISKKQAQSIIACDDSINSRRL